MTILQTMSSLGADGSVPLTPREAASGLLGSVSMTCWIFLLVCLSPVSGVFLGGVLCVETSMRNLEKMKD